jgi:predicted  nucleic acid-binding Zn-ribbon protein
MENHQHLRTLWQEEHDERGRLLQGALSLMSRLDEVKKGDPLEIDTAQKKVQKLKDEHAAALAKAQEPLDAANNSLEETTTAEAAFHTQVNLYHDTEGKERCGNDGCSGSCGICELDNVCYEIYCRCVPYCEGKNCGLDGCGGLCGECDETSRCTEEDQCILRTPDVVTDKCDSDCSSASPRGPYQTVAPVEQVHKVYRTSVKHRERQFSDVEKFAAYVASVESKIQETTKFLADFQAMAEEVKVLRPAVSENETMVRDLDRELKRLGKHINTLRTKVGSKTSKTKGLYTITDDVNKTLEDLKRDETRVVEASKKASSLRKKIKGDEKVIESHKDKMEDQSDKKKKAEKWLPALETHLKAMKEIHVGWAAAKQAMNDAVGALEAITKSFETNKKGQDALYLPMIAKAEKELEELESTSIPAKDRVASWDRGALHVVGVPPYEGLKNLVALVGPLKEAREKAWQALTEEQKAEFEKWPALNRFLSELHLHLVHLGKSHGRMQQLRAKLVSERLTAAQ